MIHLFNAYLAGLLYFLLEIAKLRLLPAECNDEVLKVVAPVTYYALDIVMLALLAITLVDIIYFIRYIVI